MYGDTDSACFRHCCRRLECGRGWNCRFSITEKYYRPSIVLSIDVEKGIAKGSARSIAGFDMFAELSKNADLLPHFGGHQMAAGMSLAVTGC